MFINWEKESTGESLGGSDLVMEADGGGDGGGDAIVWIRINNEDPDQNPIHKNNAVV
jgi:hypothetical protein